MLIKIFSSIFPNCLNKCFKNKHDTYTVYFLVKQRFFFFFISEPFILYCVTKHDFGNIQIFRWKIPKDRYNAHVSKIHTGREPRVQALSLM